MTKNACISDVYSLSKMQLNQKKCNMHWEKKYSNCIFVQEEGGYVIPNEHYKSISLCQVMSLLGFLNN